MSPRPRPHAALTFAWDCNGGAIKPYKDVITALSLPHKSDRVLALRTLYRCAEDQEAIFSALANLAAGRGERHES